MSLGLGLSRNFRDDYHVFRFQVVALAKRKRSNLYQFSLSRKDDSPSHSIEALPLELRAGYEVNEARRSLTCNLQDAILIQITTWAGDSVVPNVSQ